MVLVKEFILLQSQDIEEAGGEQNYILNRDGKRSRISNKMVELTDMISGERMDIFIARDKNGKFGVYMICNDPNRVKLIGIGLEEIYKDVLLGYINKN